MKFEVYIPEEIIIRELERYERPLNFSFRKPRNLICHVLCEALRTDKVVVKRLHSCKETTNAKEDISQAEAEVE